MAVLTPVLYNLIAARTGRPQLAHDLDRIDLYSSGGTEVPGPGYEYSGLFESEPGLDDALQPVSLDDAASGAVGVPLLTDQELRALFADMPSTSQVHQAPRASWDFWRTTSGGWAMMPGNTQAGWQLTTARLVPQPANRGRTIEFRVYDHGLEIDRTGDMHRRPPSTSSDPCVHEAHVDEPGAPYRGRCRNDSCGQGCDPQLVVVPDDGIVRLIGCRCPDPPQTPATSRRRFSAIQTGDAVSMPAEVPTPVSHKLPCGLR